MIGVVLTLLAALLAPGAPVAGCPDVAIVGIAGSGQEGYGPQVEGVVEAITAASAAEGLAIDAVALDYPAVSVSDSFGLALFNGAYDESVATGVGMLTAVLDEISQACPPTEVVLVGYSQGAEVIKRTFEGVGVPYRVGSVVLLADPTRDPSQRGVLRLGDPTAERPGAFGAVPIPNQLRPVVIDVCAEGDGICERGRFSFTAHVDGYGGSPDEVAPIVVRRIASTTRPLLRPR